MNRADLPLRTVVPVLLLLAAALAVPVPTPAAAAVPTGFADTVTFGGLTQPTAVAFAEDDRVFVAEKSGLIKVFDGLGDTAPDVFADLRTQVHNFWDRGLLGLALHPQFPATPSVYVLYAHDAAIGGTAPRWGTAGATSDGCPNPPGATGDGCVISGRLSVLTASGNVMTGGEKVLVEDWCQQYPSHSVGSLAFGADGYLYVSGGDGASFTFTDYGQDGNPVNPCGDPPGGVGAALTSPTAEGGALRSQDIRTAADATGLDGTVLRLDPATGAGAPGNPFASSTDANAERVFAYGLRNPFRMTARPGTSEMWLGDVGWGGFEEVNRVAVGGNYGWPCYEGVGRQGGYDGANLDLCESLYSQGTGAVVSPVFRYQHGQAAATGDGCATGSGSSISGLAFHPMSGGSYPDKYRGALFFSDYSRDCIWAMLAGSDGLPDPTRVEAFGASVANPVQLTTGPGGDLFYADFDGGSIRRISYTSANQAPTARFTADPTSGAPPLTVTFDGRTSSDPEGGALRYSWDLDGNGVYGDSTAATTTYTYTASGSVTAGLRVTDPEGASATATQVLRVGNTAPTVEITAPTAGTTWKVGDRLQITVAATDPDEALPASAYVWTMTQKHCSSTSAGDCHDHDVTGNLALAADRRSASYTTEDHEFPSYLLVTVTVTDSAGAAGRAERRLDPRTVDLTFATNPQGLKLEGLVVGSTGQATPFTREVIVGSKNSVSAPSPQTVRNRTYHWQSWSDGGAQAHDIVAPETATTYTAKYRQK